MDFINWWFDTHPVWSTIFTPFWTFLWCIWKGEVLRGIAAFLIFLFFSITKH